MSYYYFLLKAYAFKEASVVVPIIELSTIIAVVGGMLFLNERKDMVKKIIATVIVVVGTLFIFGIIPI
ncbi:TPA: EamA family transporter [Candidatus Woesearchaeota archaeon]|nr:EamA family transporter [Candidatus Woesearchaeota archaeon]